MPLQPVISSPEVQLWIPVISDAVKIGLGALIGAVSGYLVLRRTQRHDFQKELFRRRLDRLENIAATVQKLHVDFVNMWGISKRVRRERLNAQMLEKQYSIPEKLRIEIESLNVALVAGSKEIHAQEGSALLLGYEELPPAFSALRLALVHALDTVDPAPGTIRMLDNDEEIEEIPRILTASRDRVLHLLSRRFNES